ncbi:SelB C-terminal domain-containing protein [Crossiella sp. CA-258035]|uniref:selenocysteine-specific translation elongation factor n=1 Tax=Crossiella sp. CA-258035 TaxID=2981138 RepID=UPI0024BD0CA6|nr:selenocysteine-specific translation elongation factor [Crossiella sp. CA-258035]WHT22265.1 SelB C-terminal domain-containing protein [Crossiella sp. CA-258035]
MPEGFGFHSPPPMRVVATAGGAGAGKSTLVRALTGRDPWARLPSGRVLALVDEAVLTSVATAEAVVFVVAADQEWSEQVAMQLDALHALDIRHGLLVVTRSDLADPGPVLRRTRRAMATGALGRIESAVVSARTGAGIDRLRLVLDRLAAALPPSPEVPVRLWADGCAEAGAEDKGVLVTGTLLTGSIERDTELAVGAQDRRLRVGGLESLGRQVSAMSAPARITVHLPEAQPDESFTGAALVTPGRWRHVDVVDVRLRPLPGRKLGGVHGHLELALGSARQPVFLRVLDGDIARLRLSEPLPLRIGDKALLRGAEEVLAGCTVLDILPPELDTEAQLAGRGLELMSRSAIPNGGDELRRRGLVKAGDLLAMGCALPVAPRAGDWLIDPAELDELCQRLAALVRARAREQPYDPGVPKAEAVALLALPHRRLLEPVARAARDLGVRINQGRLVLTEGGTELPQPVRQAVEKLRAELARSPFSAPEANQLAALRLTPKSLAAAVRTGLLLRLADGVYLGPDAVERAVAVLCTLPQPFTVAAARTALGTSRRVAVPLLELLDTRRITVRLPDSRRRIRPEHD